MDAQAIQRQEILRRQVEAQEEAERREAAIEHKQAFPLAITEDAHSSWGGMTYREWVAGMFIAAIPASPWTVGWPTPDTAAQHAVDYADALIKKLKATGA